MEQQDVDKKVQQLKKLKQYKETPEEYLIDIAKRKLLEKEQELDFSLDDVWKNKTERIKAQELLDEYLKINHVSKNNFEQLKNLVYYDIMLLRLQKQISDADTVDTRVLSALNDATKQALELRKQLGFLVDKSKESPYDYIQKLFKKFEVWREQNLDGRSCTCLAKGTKILMSDFTSKNIEDVKIGDKILGFKTHPKRGLIIKKQKVLNFINQGKKSVLKIKTRDGRELICTPDHPLFVRGFAKNKENGNQLYIDAIRCFNRKIKGFNFINDRHLYYEGALLGLIESDGWVLRPKNPLHTNWKFEEQYFICQSPRCEYRAVEFILNTLKIEYSKYWRTNGWGQGAYYFNLKTKHSEYIRKLQTDLFLNKEIAIGFLAGFMLGDGHVNTDGNEIITQKNKCDLIERVFKFLSITYGKSERKTVGGIYNYSLRKQIPLIFPLSPKSTKYNSKFFKIGNHTKDDHIISIEFLKNEEQVYDLTTETENYIANGLPVHNCPHCKEIFFLKIRTDKYEPTKHPWFTGKVYTNDILWKWYKKDKKITKEEMAEVLKTHPDFIDWLDKHFYNKKEVENAEAK
jgi:intein/homing endonuclease